MGKALAKGRIVFSLFFFSSLAFAGSSQAANYPEKAITFVVGYPAGGATDLSARITADALSEVLKKPVVVLNKPGGAAAVGTAYVKNAKPDGYTLLYTGSGPILVQPQVQKTPYDSLREFKFVCQVTIFHAALAVTPDSPYKNIKDFIKHLKESAEPVNIGMNGGPNMAWIGFVDLLKEAKVDSKKVNYIVFNGDAPAIAALLGGHCTAAAANHSPMAAQAQAGKIRILGVFSAERPKCDPQVPTFKEMGYDVDIPSRYFIAAPKDAPEEVVQILEGAIRKMMGSARFQKSIYRVFQDPAFLNSKEITEVVHKEYKLYGEVLKELKVK